MRRVVILGAGAIGSYLGLRLAAAGHDTTVVARGSRLAEVTAAGLAVEMDGAVMRHRVKAVADCAGLAPADCLILCAKTHDVAAALETIAPALGRETVLVTTQNGVTTPEQVAARYLHSPVIATRIHGFFELAAGTVRHVGVPPSLLIGPASSSAAYRVAEVCAMLRQAGIDAAISTDIAADLWEKFVLTSALGGVGAATGLNAGALRADPVSWRLLADAVGEVCRLAQRRGVALPADTAARTLDFIAGFPPDATTSLMRDMMAGVPSEYESLTGAVLRLAEQCDFPVPTFRRLEAMLRTKGLVQAATGCPA